MVTTIIFTRLTVKLLKPVAFEKRNRVNVPILLVSIEICQREVTHIFLKEMGSSQGSEIKSVAGSGLDSESWLSANASFRTILACMSPLFLAPFRERIP